MPVSCLTNKKQIFDCEIMDGKTENAVKRLKSGKAAGPDGTVSEHLKYGGPVLLHEVVNSDL